MPVIQVVASDVAVSCGSPSTPSSTASATPYRPPPTTTTSAVDGQESLRSTTIIPSSDSTASTPGAGSLLVEPDAIDLEVSVEDRITYCGFGNPGTLRFNATYVTVCFHSDFSVVERGFSLRFEGSKIPGIGNLMPMGTVKYPNYPQNRNASYI